MGSNDSMTQDLQFIFFIDLGVLSCNMPLAQMVGATIADTIKGGSDDLRFIFEELRIDRHAQASIIAAGMKNPRRSAFIANDGLNAREAFKVDFGIDPAEGGAMRMLMAELVAAWHDARLQASKAADIKANKRAGEFREPPRPQDMRSMGGAYKAIHGKPRENLTPGRFLVGRNWTNSLETTLKLKN